MNLSPLFRPDFWFDLTPVAMSPLFERLFFVFFALLIIAGAVLRIRAKNATRDMYERDIMRRAAKIATTAGVLGFVVYFFTFEEIQFFGARFWFLFLAIGVLVAVVRLVRYVKKEVPELRRRDQSRVEANKYLPRRK